MDRALRILQVNTSDHGSGAEAVAMNLHRAYRDAGHAAFLAVGTRRTDDPHVLALSDDAGRNPWTLAWRKLSEPLARREGRGAGRLCRILRDAVGNPARGVEILLGHEVFDFPATRRLLEMTPGPPDILHAHNLHGNYFDLRELPAISARVPTLITLHDAWLLSGHCGHGIDCQRWEIGCGQCPDLTLYPSVRRDATAFNARRKRDLLGRSRLFISTPCHWLMDRVSRSHLAPAVREGRVIPNGVNLECFRPGDRQAARRTLGLPLEARIVVAVAANLLRNPYKDLPTLTRAIQALPAPGVLLLCLGGESPPMRNGASDMRFSPAQSPERVALHLQAADLLVHAARAETSPLVLMEAAACGIPQVASAVGGIPELVLNGETGLLVPPGNPQAMALAITRLLDHPEEARCMGRASRDLAERRFGLARQRDAFLDWYRAILAGAA